MRHIVCIFYYVVVDCVYTVHMWQWKRTHSIGTFDLNRFVAQESKHSKQRTHMTYDNLLIICIHLTKCVIRLTVTVIL